MNIKGIRVRYAEFMNLLNLLKDTVDMTEDSLEKYEMRVLPLEFQRKIRIEQISKF